MSADTTPAILITDGAEGPEYRITIAQAWENAWICDDEGKILNSWYVVDVFKQSPVVASTIEDARHALINYAVSTRRYVEYAEQVLDLTTTRPVTNLERHLGIVPTFTFADLVEQAKQWETLMPATRV